MLFLTSLATAFAPVQEGTPEGETATESTSETSTSETAVPDPGAGEPQLIRQGLDTAQDRPPTVKAETGDQLQLRVTSRNTGTIELLGIGPTEDVGPEQPAFFDVLLVAEGTFPVRVLDTEREIATIQVASSESQPSR